MGATVLSTGASAESGSTRQKIQALIQSAPSTTNLQALEIYDPQAQTQTNALLPIRKDVARFVYLNEGGIANQTFVEIFQLPQLNRFYIQDPPRYYGPFEGDPFKVLGGTRREKPPRTANPPRVNAVRPEPDNPLGLDTETVARLFETGKLLRNVALIVSQWAASHRRIPATLAEVYAPYINRDELANDPFGDSKLEVKNAVGRIQIFSVGPDGVWDEGRPVFPDDPSLTGDLGVEIEVGARSSQWLLDGPLLQYLEGNRTARYLAAKTRRSETPAKPLDRSDGNLTFGPVVDGLSAAIELVPTNGVFALDRPIEVRFHIRNETNYDIQVAGSSWRQGDRLIAEDDKGRPVNMAISSYSDIPTIQREVLKPGQSAIFRSSGLEFLNPQTQASYPVGYTVIAKPGRCTVRAKLLFRGLNAEVMDWQGELETGRVTLNLKPGSTAAKSTR